MPLADTILVVEHDSNIREVLVAVLTDEGYHTCVAPTGRGGLAALSRDRPALTLFDMALPDLSAGELVDELQAMGLTGTRVVLMSTVPRDASSALAPGTLAYLAKPFDIDALLTLVARYVDRPIQAHAATQDADPPGGASRGQ